MAMDPDGRGDREYEPPSDNFWPQFWFNVCKYSEYYYMLLIVITLFLLLNTIAVLAADQSVGAAVVSAMVYVVLGVTWLFIAFVLRQCKKLRSPDVDDTDDAPDSRQDLAERQSAGNGGSSPGSE